MLLIEIKEFISVGIPIARYQFRECMLYVKRAINSIDAQSGGNLYSIALSLELEHYAQLADTKT